MLLALGDSFTVKRYDNDKPWPMQLAKIMKINLDLRAIEGGSNMYMFKNFWHAVLTENITHCVIALSNWDRLEFGTNVKHYDNITSRSKSLKPKIMSSDTHPHEVRDFYFSHYDPRYYYDLTVSHLLGIYEYCKTHNIVLKIIQPILPFHPLTFTYKEVDVDRYMIEKHIKQCKLFHGFDNDVFVGYTWSPSNIAWGNGNKNDMMFWFCKDLKYVLGFHDLDLYYVNQYKNYKEFDYHPTIYGHKKIAETVYESINT